MLQEQEVNNQQVLVNIGRQTIYMIQLEIVGNGHKKLATLTVELFVAGGYGHGGSYYSVYYRNDGGDPNDSYNDISSRPTLYVKN